MKVPIVTLTLSSLLFAVILFLGVGSGAWSPDGNGLLMLGLVTTVASALLALIVAAPRSVIGSRL